MNLIIDVGNSRLSFGYFDNGKLVNVTSVNYSQSISQEEMENILLSVKKDINIKNCIISSVVDEINDILQKAVNVIMNVNPIILNSGMDLGLKILSQTPEKIGMDRIANALAASRMYKNRPLIVVDCGSATTFDIINKEGSFIGGVIFPGLYMQLKALASNTSKLPELSLDGMKNVQTVINNETTKAILSGVINAQAQAILGLILECEKELEGTPFVIGTGGDAKFLSQYMIGKGFGAINTNLTLEGINMIYELNKN